MKKSFAILSFSIISIISNAQNHKNVVAHYNIYDSSKVQIFQVGKKNPNKRVQKIWWGKKVDFDVIANPYLYDVYIGSEQIMESAPEQDSAIALFTNTINNFRKAKETVANTDTDKSETPKTETASASNATVQDVQSISHNNIPPSTINNQVESLTVDEIKDSLTNKDISSPTKNLFNNIIASYNRYYGTILIDVQAKINAEKNEYEIKRNSFLNSLTNFDSILTGFRNITGPCNDILNAVLDDKASSEDIKNSIEDILNYYQLDSIKRFKIAAPYYKELNSENLATAFKMVKTNYLDLKNTKDGFTNYTKHNFKNDSDIYVQYVQAFDLVNKADPEEIIPNIVAILRNLEYKGSFSHPYHTIDAQADTLKFLVQLKSSARYDSLIKKYGIKTFNADSVFPVTIPVGGMFKLNFSIGMAFQYGSLKPRTYFYDSVLRKDGSIMTDTLQIREGQITNRFRPLVAAYGHAYFNVKWLNCFTPAITLGVSTNPSDLIDASFMAGLSLIFGQQNRFIATFGVAGSGVDYLKGKYSLNTNYAKSRFDNIPEADLVEKTFRVGTFLGVSYNLSKK